MNSSGAEWGASLASGFGSKSGEVSNAGKSIASAALHAITEQGALFSAGASGLVNSLKEGLIAGTSTIAEAARSLASSAVSAAKAYEGNFYQVGRFFAGGLGNGLESYTFMVGIRARALAIAALEAARNALNVASPSKETYKLGEFFGMGFSNALADYTDIVEKDSYAFGMAAKDGLNRAIEESNRLIMSSDISNNPRITPVLDLSEIQSGVGTLGNMLALDAPIGVTGNLTAIGSNLNGRNTATSGDILSALHALGTTLGNKPSGDTYNINGVTYDDGSNITEAVRSLIRAARVERRA